MNNIQVAILAFAAGILLCLGAAYILVFNGANVGVAAGLFVAAGESPKFFGLILPRLAGADRGDRGRRGHPDGLGDRRPR